MTTLLAETRTLPDLAALPLWEHDDSGDEWEAHLFCCDKLRALCGVSLADAVDDFGPPDDDELCPDCRDVDAMDIPCGAPLCRVRQWWRGRRS